MRAWITHQSSGDRYYLDGQNLTYNLTPIEGGFEPGQCPVSYLLNIRYQFMRRNGRWNYRGPYDVIIPYNSLTDRMVVEIHHNTSDDTPFPGIERSVFSSATFNSRVFPTNREHSYTLAVATFDGSNNVLWRSSLSRSNRSIWSRAAWSQAVRQDGQPDECGEKKPDQCQLKIYDQGRIIHDRTFENECPEVDIKEDECPPGQIFCDGKCICDPNKLIPIADKILTLIKGK